MISWQAITFFLFEAVLIVAVTEASLLAYTHPKSASEFANQDESTTILDSESINPDISGSQAIVDFKLTEEEDLATVIMPESTSAPTSSLATQENDPATMNILIIGSQYDSTKVFWTDKSRSFPGSPIRDELQKILEGGMETDNAKLGSITNANVVFEERYDFHEGAEVFNLASWFHWPNPVNVQKDTRWPNLRNEGPIEWDYIVLIEDSYTIENMPGLYTHGVAIISEEIARAPGKKAEVVLLMAWPNQISESTVDHYKEVTYRTGRTSGFKVAPAGLAWQAAGSPEDTTNHAYIAAATLFSRIWGNAVSSSYKKQNLASIIDATVTENIGKVQYTGKWAGQYLGEFKNNSSPFTMNYNKRNPLGTFWASGGTSTESQIRYSTDRAIWRAGNTAANRNFGDSETVFNGRNTFGGGNKSYKRVPEGASTFGYEYQSEDGSDTFSTFKNIFSKEIVLAKSMISWGDNARLIPRRMMIADGIKKFPDMQLQQDGSHLSKDSLTQVGTFIYTLTSGRTPVDRQPTDIPQDWYSQKIGYETAWHFGALSTRAPGFKVRPIGTNAQDDDRGAVFLSGSDGKIEVEFLFPPREEVTVIVSAEDNASVLVSPQSLLFTVENYNVPQILEVKAKVNAVEVGTFKLAFVTDSDDAAYHGLDDEWTLSF